MTADPEPTNMEEGIRRWVSHTEKHPQARRFDGTAFGDKILEMGFIPALLKVTFVIVGSLDHSTPAAFLACPGTLSPCRACPSVH